MNKPPMQIHMAHMHARACKNHLPRFVSQIMIDRSNDTDTPVLVPHLIVMAYIFMAYMVMAYIVMADIVLALVGYTVVARVDCCLYFGLDMSLCPT